ncbi:hypothetical protein CVT26_014761, partial [Gymnopilus dilepis]
HDFSSLDLHPRRLVPIFTHTSVQAIPCSPFLVFMAKRKAVSDDGSTPALLPPAEIRPGDSSPLTSDDDASPTIPLDADDSMFRAPPQDRIQGSVPPLVTRAASANSQAGTGVSSATARVTRSRASARSPETDQPNSENIQPPADSNGSLSEPSPQFPLPVHGASDDDGNGTSKRKRDPSPLPSPHVDDAATKENVDLEKRRSSA